MGRKQFLGPDEVSEYQRVFEGEEEGFESIGDSFEESKKVQKRIQAKRFITVAGKKLTESEYKGILRVIEIKINSLFIF